MRLKINSTYLKIFISWWLRIDVFLRTSFWCLRFSFAFCSIFLSLLALHIGFAENIPFLYYSLLIFAFGSSFRIYCALKFLRCFDCICVQFRFPRWRSFPPRLLYYFPEFRFALVLGNSFYLAFVIVWLWAVLLLSCLRPCDPFKCQQFCHSCVSACIFRSIGKQTRSEKSFA